MLMSRSSIRCARVSASTSGSRCGRASQRDQAKAAAQAIHATDARKATSTECEFMSGPPVLLMMEHPSPPANLRPTRMAGEARPCTTTASVEVHPPLTCDHLVTYHDPCMTTTW